MILATPFPARIRHSMATTRSALTDADIHTLIKGASIEERALAAHKLCRNIDRPDLSDEDRIQAHEILRVMANDAAELVRRALAVTLKQSAVVPRDVANKLARDVESIALPLLNFSPAFSDEDLAEIVRLGGPVRQVAIAKRPELSETVTGALVEHGGEKCRRRAPTTTPASPTACCSGPSTGSRTARPCWARWPIAEPCPWPCPNA
jgi:uncharacterized protein (DUF2336 family)